MCIRDRGWRIYDLSRKSLVRLIQVSDAKYLAGLKRVVLVEASELVARERKRHTSRPGRSLLGSYRAGTSTATASIELYVDAIFNGRPEWTWRMGFLRELFLARVFYHELGHHIVRSIEPVSGDKELHAERWRKELTRVAFRRRYGVLVIPARPLARALRWFSNAKAKQSAKRS